MRKKVEEIRKKKQMAKLTNSPTDLHIRTNQENDRPEDLQMIGRTDLVSKLIKFEFRQTHLGSLGFSFQASCIEHRRVVCSLLCEI